MLIAFRRIFATFHAMRDLAPDFAVCEPWSVGSSRSIGCPSRIGCRRPRPPLARVLLGNGAAPVLPSRPRKLDIQCCVSGGGSKPSARARFVKSSRNSSSLMRSNSPGSPRSLRSMRMPDNIVSSLRLSRASLICPAALAFDKAHDAQQSPISG